jgi:hypothetical protein
MVPPLPPGSKLELKDSFTELVCRDISWWLLFEEKIFPYPYN